MTTRENWLLDPDVTYLNHGSFGATPIAVLDVQNAIRGRMEREPVLFLARELESLLDAARARLASFLGADEEGLAFVPNATTGVNAVLRSLDLDRFDELLVTDHEYNACRNALDFVAGQCGAKVVVVEIPFPLSSADEVAARILERVTERTRLLLVDHVTSQTALILPVERIVTEMRERGVDVLIDGAHAPGMLPLNLAAIGAAYYTGNLHKWVCAPKGAAFLHVRRDRRASIRPVAISHGANADRTDRPRFLLEFDWTGTFDPSAWLSVPAALDAIARIGGGWPAVMQHNHELTIYGRDALARALGIAPPAPDAMLGSTASLPLPDPRVESGGDAFDGGPLQQALFERHRIEVPIMPWPHSPRRLIRISAQLYNERAEYDRLAAVLPALLREGL